MHDPKIVTFALLNLLVIGFAHAEGDARARRSPVQGDAPPATSSRLAPTKSGPSLHGVFSRKAGELTDFRYSPAMKRSGVSWTPEALDKYLADPQAFIPGEPHALCPACPNAADIAPI